MHCYPLGLLHYGLRQSKCEKWFPSIHWLHFVNCVECFDVGMFYSESDCFYSFCTAGTSPFIRSVHHTVNSSCGQSHLVAVWQFYRVTNWPVAFQICRVSNWSNGYHKLTVRGDVAVCRRWAWPMYPAERRVVYSEWVWGGVRSVEQQRLEAQYPLRRSNSAVPHWGRHIGTTRHVLHLLRMLQRRFCGMTTERW